MTVYSYMARPLRIEYPGAFYHITSRGNSRQDIFKTKKDFFDILDILKDNIERYDWKCYAYCLMSNHYHLLIKTLDPNLSQGMRQLNGVYTQKFNYNHKTVGHLFQGRYKAILVDEEKYFYELVRYIVLNPVRAKMVKRPENYPWSSHKEMLANGDDNIIERNDILKRFDSLEEYKKYINLGVGDSDIWEDLKGGFVLGSVSFVEKISKFISEESKKSVSIKKKERYVGRPTLSEIFGKKDVSMGKRNDLIYKAYNEYGYFLAEIGRKVDLHDTTVGKIIKKLVGERR